MDGLHRLPGTRMCTHWMPQPDARNGLPDKQVRYRHTCRPRRDVYVGTSDSARFMALDAKTGRLKFNFDAKAYMFSSAALAGDLAYVGNHNGKLYPSNTKTGN